LSIVGAFFPQVRGLNRPQKDAGEGSATFGNISVVVRGGARFAVVVAGILLIVGGILKGVQSAAGEKAKESLAEQQKQRLRLDTLQTYVDGLKQAKLVPDEKQVAEMERLLGECCKSSEQQIKRLEPIATGSSPQPSMQPSNVIEMHEHKGEFKEW
jgi:hypothetical protein